MVMTFTEAQKDPTDYKIGSFVISVVYVHRIIQTGIFPVLVLIWSSTKVATARRIKIDSLILCCSQIDHIILMYHSVEVMFDYHINQYGSPYFLFRPCVKTQ